MGEIVRLQKYIAMCGVASRRKAEELIEKGTVKVNGEKIGYCLTGGGYPAYRDRRWCLSLHLRSTSQQEQQSSPQWPLRFSTRRISPAPLLPHPQSVRNIY